MKGERMFHRKLAAFAIAASALASEPSHAQGFLPPTQAISLLMDGRPWSAETGDGMHGKVTLNKNGTGDFEGMPTSWSVQGDDICLHNAFAGTRCLRFRKVAGAFEGWLGNAVDLHLSR
jgi:hypothetical protein